MRVLHTYWWDPVEKKFRWVLKNGLNYRWCPTKSRVWQHNGTRWRALSPRRAEQARDVLLNHVGNENHKLRTGRQHEG